MELDELGAFLDELGRLVLDELDAASQQQLDAIEQAARPAARLVGVRVRVRARVRVSRQRGPPHACPQRGADV